jgi:hypothetical protein
VDNAQRSQRETATSRLRGCKRLDAKLPLSRVLLDLVEWFWFLFDVFDLFDGGEQVLRGLYIFIKNSSAAERR